jgi:hypothetical protein
MNTKTGSKITKRPSSKATSPAPTVTESEAEKFISGAPDSAPMSTARKGVQRGKREQISHTLPHELLALLDESAKAKGLTRAGLINLAISEYIRK